MARFGFQELRLNGADTCWPCQGNTDLMAQKCREDSHLQLTVSRIGTGTLPLGKLKKLVLRFHELACWRGSASFESTDFQGRFSEGRVGPHHPSPAPYPPYNQGEPASDQTSKPQFTVVMHHGIIYPVLPFVRSYAATPLRFEYVLIGWRLTVLHWGTMSLCANFHLFTPDIWVIMSVDRRCCCYQGKKSRKTSSK